MSYYGEVNIPEIMPWEIEMLLEPEFWVKMEFVKVPDAFEISCSWIVAVLGLSGDKTG